MKDSFFLYLENVVFSTSEGCQYHSPRERVTMFSHGAGVAPVAGVMVSPEARQGTARKARYRHSGLCREAR